MAAGSPSPLRRRHPRRALCVFSGALRPVSSPRAPSSRHRPQGARAGPEQEPAALGGAASVQLQCLVSPQLCGFSGPTSFLVGRANWTCSGVKRAECASSPTVRVSDRDGGGHPRGVQPAPHGGEPARATCPLPTQPAQPRNSDF